MTHIKRSVWAPVSRVIVLFTLLWCRDNHTRRQTNEGENGQKSNTTPPETWTNTIWGGFSLLQFHLLMFLTDLSRYFVDRPCFRSKNREKLWKISAKASYRSYHPWQSCLFEVQNNYFCIRTMSQWKVLSRTIRLPLFVLWVSSCWALTSPPKHIQQPQGV